MFLYSSFFLLRGGGLALALALFGIFLALGLVVQLWICHIRAPLPARLLPPVLCALVLLLIGSFYAGWLFLPLRAYNTLVRGGMLRVWGILAEGFLLGTVLGWIAWIVRPRVKKK